uniref:Uncharacterized protein n=1 Tax=Romanomermis culicivorax TaxID=13658 RepID=A0A915JJK3_ROMCU
MNATVKPGSASTCTENFWVKLGTGVNSPRSKPGSKAMLTFRDNENNGRSEVLLVQQLIDKHNKSIEIDGYRQKRVPESQNSQDVIPH